MTETDVIIIMWFLVNPQSGSDVDIVVGIWGWVCVSYDHRVELNTVGLDLQDQLVIGGGIILILTWNILETMVIAYSYLRTVNVCKFER